MIEKEKREVAVTQNSGTAHWAGLCPPRTAYERCTKEADIAFSTAMVSEANRQTIMAKAKPNHPEFGPYHPKNRKPLPSEDPELGAEDNPKRKPVPGERVEIQRFGRILYIHKFSPGKGWSTRSKEAKPSPSRKRR